VLSGSSGQDDDGEKTVEPVVGTGANIDSSSP
jgi:hypothetical protein